MKNIYLGQISSDSLCGDWLSYRDEKCFSVVDTVVPASGAGTICENLKATFGLISSAEQQDMVYNHLKNISFADNIWVGIKKIDKSFKSIEGTSLKYTNWNSGRPVNQPGFDCVEIDLELEGKWMDAKCEKKNAVLCEKNQQRSITKIENVLQEVKKNFYG